jgi:hypothetical protein
MMGKRVWKDGVAVGFLLLLNSIYFLPVLAKGNGAVLSLRGTDTWTQFYYWRHFASESLARGEMPLWNPYIFSGTPFIAGIQSAIFYPLNLLFVVFPTPFAINFSIALHCFLASLFTYFYSRYLGIRRSGAALSALCFAYGAPYFLHIFAGHLPHLSTMVWLPLLFLGVEAFLKTRELRYAVLGGIALALQLFAGFPQYLVYSVIAVSLYFATRLIMTRTARDVPFFLSGYAVFLITAMLLGAVQLFPTAEFASYSFRETLSYEWVAIFSLPPEKLLTLLVPDFFGNIVDAPYWGKNYPWEMSVYVGVIPLALAVVALLFDWRDRVIAFAVIAAASLVLALGKYTPLLAIFYNFVPSFDRFRGLSKFAFIFAFAIAMLAGFGLAKLTVLAERKKATVTHLSYVLLGVPILLIVLAVAGPSSEEGWWHSLIESYGAGPDRYYSLPPLTSAVIDRVMSVAFSSLVASCILLTLLGAGLLVLVKKKKFSGYVLPAILILAAADLWHFGSRYLVYFSPQDILMDKEVRALLKTDPEPFRIASPLYRFLNIGLNEGIENVGGYDTLVLKKYTEFTNFAQDLPLEEPSTAMPIQTTSPLLDLLNVRYFVLSESMRLDEPDFRLVFENENYRVYRNHKALPRSFIVHDARVARDRDEALRLMASRGFNPAQTAVVEETVASLKPNPSVQSPLPTFRERSLNRVLIEANLNAPGLLVLADAFYPGWKCFVDGKENKIYRANYVLRAVFVPSGKHTVEFKYDPWSFKIGAIISLLTLIVLVGWFTSSHIKDRTAL